MDHGEHTQPTGQPIAGGLLRAKITGMDCGSCALTIEDGLRQLPGVRRASVDFTTETLEVEGAESLAQVDQRLRQLGYGLGVKGNTGITTGAAQGSAGFLRFLFTQPQPRLALTAAATALLAAVVSSLMPIPATQSMLRWTLVAAVVLVGAPIFSKGLRALIFSRRVNIDLLMTVAALGALLIGETGEAATVVLLFALGEGLEGFSAARARDSLRSLLSLQPQTATVLRGHAQEDSHDHGHEDGPDHAHWRDQTPGDDQPHAHEHKHSSAHGCDQTHVHEHAQTHAHTHEHGDCGKRGKLDSAVVRAEDLAPGDLMLVKPGERIAADGVVKSGQSSVNQAAVTGESIPVAKTSGDPVMAGTVNAEGALEVEVTRKSSDSTVARIARLVEEAQAKRSPTERFIDRFARWYTPAVVVLAILLVAVPVLAFGQPFLDADGTKGWLYRGLTLLIVACPCALVISIPVTVVSSLTRLARLGVLVKGGEQLDKLAEIRTIAFDKTGTLTHGRPGVTAVQARGCDHETPAEPACDTCDDVIALAASVERSSEHPIAGAIMDAARTRGVEDRYPPAHTIVASAGRGVTGELRGNKIAVGIEALMNAQGAASVPDFVRLNESSRTVMMVARNSQIVGAIGVEDSVRDESRAVLDELRRSRPPMRTVMLTGDNARVALDVAQRIGALDDVRADLLPSDKLAAITELQRLHGPVAMVGDGINDAPALARADVGIAMGGAGTAQAMETAAVVLMEDNLHRLPAALRVARRNRTIVKQNIALSLGLKLAFLALAIPGLATLWLAVLADVGATVLVTLNGMRMLRAK
ncbi:MAG: heavy metal translocating P-type ATPase [Gammaproteobacteria bacterium]|nr:heavy metal translocating P-type ATPase [Gammaproteobacteria bacterium]